MARTAAQWANQRATHAKQIGISGDEYQGRLDTMRSPEYNAAFYNSRGFVPESTLQHQASGGTVAGLLGDKAGFLDRGGLGAPATGTQAGIDTNRQQSAQTALALGAGKAAPGGFRGVASGIAPGSQPPQGAGGTSGAVGFGRVQSPGGGRQGLRTSMGAASRRSL